MGTTDAKLITPDNPFGIDPKDPKGADDILISSPELHLPVNKPVRMLLRSTDVNHQFAVAQFRVKMDLVPGMVTYFWFTPTRTGRFDVLCEQLCGMAHFAMRGRVVVDDESAFRTWLSNQPSYAKTMTRAAGDVTATLVPAAQRVRGRVITREAMVLCGVAWVEDTFRQLDPQILDPQQRFRHQRNLGLKASRSQSPSRFTDRISVASTTPGKIEIHQSPENR